MKKILNFLAVFFSALFGMTQKPKLVRNSILYKNFNAVTVTSNYVGDVTDVLFSLLRNGNQAVEKGSVHVVSGVEKELFLPRFNANADQLQDRQENPDTPSDSFVWDERSIAPKDCMFFDLVNPRTFESVWRPWQPTGPLVDRVNNPQMQSAIIEETMKSVGTQVGKLIWQGDVLAGAADPLRFFDGFVKILNADGAINPPPQGVITQSNVLSILASVEASIPSEVWEDPNMIIHMNTTDFRLYSAAARALDFKGVGIEDAGLGRYAGKTIRFYTGMTKDNIIVAKSTAGSDSNLWGAVDVNGDDENVKILRYRPESELFIVKVLFTYGVNSPNPTETVLYKPI